MGDCIAATPINGANVRGHVRWEGVNVFMCQCWDIIWRLLHSLSLTLAVWLPSISYHQWTEQMNSLKEESWKLSKINCCHCCKVKIIKLFFFLSLSWMHIETHDRMHTENTPFKHFCRAVFYLIVAACNSCGVSLRGLSREIKHNWGRINFLPPKETAVVMAKLIKNTSLKKKKTLTRFERWHLLGQTGLMRW